MSGLTPAVLTRLGAKDKPTGDAIRVQFNPNTLTFQSQNSTDGARSRGRQKTQYNGSASVTLSVDLEFDSTDATPNVRDLGATDVRRLTKPIRDLIIPTKKKGSKAAPPRIAFTWGTIKVSGVMESVKEDLTYFSKDGVPLHAKLSVQIKGQDPRFDAKQIGPGANERQHAPPSGDSPIRPNVPAQLSPRATDSTTPALDGESPLEFLDRVGLPAEAWRNVAEGLDDDFELPPGVPVDFASDPTGSVGSLLSVGIDSRVVEVDDVLAGRVGSGLGAGIALSGAGGVAAGLASAVVRKATEDFARARDDFAITIGASPNRLRAEPDTTSVDPRAATFGAGVPLRPTVRIPAERLNMRFPRLAERLPAGTKTPPTPQLGHKCDPHGTRRWDR